MRLVPLIAALALASSAFDALIARARRTDACAIEAWKARPPPETCTKQESDGDTTEQSREQEVKRPRRSTA